MIGYGASCIHLQTPGAEGANVWEDVAFTVYGGRDRPGAAEGFVLEPEEAKRLLNKLEAVHDQLTNMRRISNNLCGMKAPSQDPATLAMHTALIGDGRGTPGAFSRGNDHVSFQLDYVSEFILRIRRALGMTESSDQHQAGLIDNVGARGKTG
ncbi:hypothetical protein [Amycolatopsis jejuensis]|uniref:hypothetical protein n=1 Tax=Amycolatopsis jejuensis TaxID=330084 RepID=UPI001FDF29BC|nr:hypothetical protein [Amycolatopsis jejuensis]